MASETELEAAKRHVLGDVFGFDGFRPGQEPVVDTLLGGTNALAVMPTGAGKSLCFQVPALIREGLCVVVSPLVALMQDQVAALRLAGVEADAINSSRSRDDNVAAWRRAQTGECKLLYMAPERLMTPRMLDALGRLDLSLIVVDEAHCIAQWGPSFRPDYADLSRLKELFPGVPLGAFTATADTITRDEIAEKLFAGNVRIFVAGFDRPNIRLSVEMKRSAPRQALSFIDGHRGEAGIVYCLSRAKTERMAGHLVDNGIRALPYHAGMDKGVRDENQDVFMREAGVVMVATIAFGMGIDKPDVRFVLHTDLPGTMEAYYQELGRAGRDGEPARAHMLYGLDDIRMRRMFIEDDGDDEERKRREHKRLDALIAYCESPSCRRSTLLAYFGEEIDGCGNCDTCLEPVELVEAAREGQMALSAVMRTGQMFGAAHIVDVLVGAKTEKIAKFRHEALTTYGIGAELDKAAWRSILRQLVAGQFLRIDIAGHGGLSVTHKGRELIKGDEGFAYRPDVVKRTKKKKSRAPAEALPDEPLSAPEEDLLSRLRALRSNLAKQRGVPAYVVFHDRSLMEMARIRPGTRDEFAQIHGVGEAKLDAFAENFLECIASHPADGAA